MHSATATPIPHYLIIVVALLSGSHVVFLIWCVCRMGKQRLSASSLMRNEHDHAMVNSLVLATVKLISDSLALGLSYLPASPEWLYLFSAFSIIVALFIEARKRSFSRQRERLPALLASWLSPLIRVIIGFGVSRSSLPSFFVTVCGLACEYLIECASMKAKNHKNWFLFHCRELVASTIFLALIIPGAVMKRDFALLFGVVWISVSALLFPFYPIWVKFCLQKPKADADTGLQRLYSHTANESHQESLQNV